MTNTLLAMPEISAPVAERVAYGAQVMDEIRPDWYERVDRDLLDMSDGEYCIIGQAIENCCFGCAIYDFEWDLDDAIRRGLYLNSRGDQDYAEFLAEYRELGELWKTEIAKRLDAAAQAMPDETHGTFVVEL